MPNGEIKEYQSGVPIKIANEIRGDERNWDRVTMTLEGEDETFVESSRESRLEIWNRNYRKIAQELDGES